ncbi:sigma-70 family RNA polymerase sigma factor [Clostridium novyi]|uniref:Transcriptional regulator n=1 Tax=Clostridium novyi B str. ATCC 27606 TaxID=1443123 RepID=A0AA40M4C1_CLONO|nr:sigma-70 family RNA polymerase sigma factor [Clostridium novyi]KEI11452.1 putative transcriptional regulator [Clostridium novyi B str. ATCC 27606]
MKIVKFNNYSDLEIYRLILDVRNNKKEALDCIFKIFANKINDKMNKTYTDELHSFLCELIIKLPLEDLLERRSLINYILSSIKKKKYNLYKNKYEIISFEDRHEILNKLSVYDIEYNKLLYMNIISSLDIKEKDIIILYYIYGYTVSEIASIMGVTKQAISQKKARILTDLKNKFCND